MQIGKYQFHEIGDRLFRKVGDRVLLWDRDRFCFYRIRKTRGMEIVVEEKAVEIKYDLWKFQSSFQLNQFSVKHISIPKENFPVDHLERLTIFPHDFVEGNELKVEDVRRNVHRIIALDDSTIICCRQGVIRIYCK